MSINIGAASRFLSPVVSVASSIGRGLLSITRSCGSRISEYGQWITTHLGRRRIAKEVSVLIPADIPPLDRAKILRAAGAIIPPSEIREFILGIQALKFYARVADDYIEMFKALQKISAGQQGDCMKNLLTSNYL